MTGRIHQVIVRVTPAEAEAFLGWMYQAMMRMTAKDKEFGDHIYAKFLRARNEYEEEAK